MPWEAPLQSILESIQGPVAKIMAVIIITCGFQSIIIYTPIGRFFKVGEPILLFIMR